MSYELSIGGQLGAVLDDMLPRATARAHRRFPQVPAEDFESEMMLRVLADLPKFRRLAEQGTDGAGIIWAELRRAATRLGSEDDRYRRAVKAAKAGYSTEDEQFYSAGMLRQLLPVLIEADFDPALAVERATQGTDAAGVRIHGSSPENATETYTVILIDVATAYKSLSPYHRKLLKDYFSLDQSNTDNGRWERETFASSQGMTLLRYQNRVRRAVGALQEKLGGRSPWIRERSAETA